MIYINGLANISPQPTLNKDNFLADIRQYHTNMLQCTEPDYSEFFKATALRRISRVLKLGWAGAKSCLDDAGLKTPDSICVGTGSGCYNNTQDFIFSVEENEEQFVPPSPFIQSAHGSIAAQIAIQTGCKNYNMTYAHRTFSFESALLDTMMLLQEGNYKNVLVGGVDEIAERLFKTFDRIGYYKKPDTNNLQLLAGKSKGTIAGEGSAFFLLERFPSEKTYAGIQAVHTFSNPKNNSVTKETIEAFLKRESLNVKDIDFFILGLNGDSRFDAVYYDLMKTLFPENNQAFYKHLCGEYYTSSAFALWISAMSIHRQQVPEIIRLNKKPSKAIKNILIYNQYRNVNHSLILVSKVSSTRREIF
jgi:3-oxoacyl-(acyl-carrier-protein) synthase